MAVKPRESWLRGGDTDADHERFAAAMIKCQHPMALCADDGYCHLDGDCFRSASESCREAASLVRNIQTDSQMVRGWLNDAAEWLVANARQTPARAHDMTEDRG